MATNQTHSIFEESWWLEATAPGRWGAVEIEEGGSLVARLPYVVKRKFGLRLITQPVLTQTLGPWVAHTSESASKRLAREKDLFTKLISKLPKHDSFSQNFHSDVTNWLPFYWQGFQQTTRYSYVIEDLSDLASIRSRFSKTTRQSIGKAEANLIVDHDGTVEDLGRLARLTFERQGLALPYPVDLLHRIDSAVSRYAKRRILIALDGHGNRHAALYLVGDERRTYTIVTGVDPRFRNSGAINLLYWEALKVAAEFTDVFDFEGSMIPGIEEHYRKFGGRLSPYSSVSRATGVARAATLVRQVRNR